MISALLVAYQLTTVPPVQEITQAQTSTVLYSQGKGVITRFAVDEGNRTIVKIEDIPQYVRMSVVSAEDRTFYENRGISPVGILRAAWNDLQNKPLQGGSTITQQYVKNSRITNEQTYSRKIKEFFIAIKIANQTDKNQLLGEYLNTIFFGRGTYGIQAAARAYFGKNATLDPKHPDATISLQQAAYLAGIIDGPSQYEPQSSDSATTKAKRKALAKQRYDYVLDGLVQLKVISQADRDGKLAAMPDPIPYQPQVARSGQVDDQTVYLKQMVRAELSSLGFKQEDIDTGGYNIYTTFDKDLMDQAVKSVQQTLGPRTVKGKPNWPAGTQIGLTSIDPTTGAVRAIYGGDGTTRFFNAASQDRPRAGSTFKVFALLAALEGDDKSGENGIALASRINGVKTYHYAKPYAGTTVSNFADEAPFGYIDLKQALAQSVNTVFAQLNEKVDPKHTRDAALRAGIPEKSGGNEVVGTEISNTLGNASVSTVDMASAYGTIADKGYHAKAYVIDRIVRSDGTVVYRHKDAPDKAFTEQVAADAIAAMQQVVKSGTARWANGKLDRPIAGKTGTVGDTGSRNTYAAWFVGFTPQLSTAVSIFRQTEDDTHKQLFVQDWGELGKGPMAGGDYPLRVWVKFMQSATKGMPVVDFPAEADIGEVLNPPPPKVETPPSPSPSFPGQGQDGQGQPGQGQTGPGQTGPGQNQPGQPSATGQPGADPNNGGQNGGGAPTDGGNNGGGNGGQQSPPGQGVASP